MIKFLANKSEFCVALYSIVPVVAVILTFITAPKVETVGVIGPLIGPGQTETVVAIKHFSSVSLDPCRLPIR